MKDYLENITPDGVSGILFALEGVRGALVLLNGPTGCKFYHSSVSDSQFPRPSDFEKYNYGMQWFFGQSRIPCTYLDNSDYVYGSTEKLETALAAFAEDLSFRLIAVVNSPGAALIGDDLAGIAARVLPGRPVITVQTPGFSEDICLGYAAACRALLSAFAPEMRRSPAGQYGVPDPSRGGDGSLPAADARPASSAPRQTQPFGHDAPALPEDAPSVNVLGLSLYHRNFEGDRAEITRLLGLCGIRVNCFLCAGSPLDEILRIPAADANLVLYPEYGADAASYLEENFGMPAYVCDGPPIGFAASEKLAREICRLLSAARPGPDAALEDIARARARAYSFLSRVNAVSGLPRGAAFAVEGTCSELYAYISFFTEYLGLLPVCASVQNPGSDCFRPRLEALLDRLSLRHILEEDIDETDADLVFASGNTIARCKIKGHPGAGAEIALPSIGYFDVLPKTLLGARGALQLIEFVLNGLDYSS